jgi:hypothetical protein
LFGQVTNFLILTFFQLCGLVHDDYGQQIPLDMLVYQMKTLKILFHYHGITYWLIFYDHMIWTQQFFFLETLMKKIIPYGYLFVCVKFHGQFLIKNGI